MGSAGGFTRSSIGRKVVMASTGVILVGFVIAHMVGNLQVYLGPAAMNHYAVFLRQVVHGAGLWIARIVLLVAAILHIWAAASLTRTSHAARKIAYRRREWTESTYASRTMRWGGVIILLFVIYHVLHFTTGTLHPDYVEGDVYHNFVAGFRVVPVSIAYVVAMIALGLHLRHGVWSMFQTLGVSHPRYLRAAHALAWVVAVVVVVGNISFPLAVLAGVVK